MILDVKLHYFGSLGLDYYSYNRETYRFFRRLSSGCTVQRQARSKRGRGQHNSGRGRRKIFARFARTVRRTPLSQYPASAPALISPLNTRNSVKEGDLTSYWRWSFWMRSLDMIFILWSMITRQNHQEINYYYLFSPGPRVITAYQHYRYTS